MKEALLLSHIESIRLKREPGQAIGVHSKSRWQGKDQVLAGQEKWSVFQCDSVLEMRQRLIENSLTPLLLITALPTAAIGDDVRARLFKQQLMPVDPWNSLAERFKAKQVDPALRQSTVIADAAIDALGSNEAPVATSGILTAEAVWKVILQNRLGIDQARPDLLDFLPWIASEGSAVRWISLGVELQSALEQWLVRSVGDLTPILIRSLIDGYGPDVIAIGLALGALSNAGTDSRALGRLERYTGNQPLSDSQARRWNEAAENWAVRERTDCVRRELTRADQVLDGLGATAAAVNSRWSPIGFQQRLDEFAKQLAGGDLKKCQHAYSFVASHVGSQYLEELKDRRERSRMAIRLIRWQSQLSDLPSSLKESVSSYECVGSWVDYARYQLVAAGEPEGVARSYRALFDKVTARREKENRRFGELLVSATARDAPLSEILVVEDVLRTIVAPLANRSLGGVLFIVMDGMSFPVWRELSSDLREHGWMEWTRVNGSSWQSALAVLPSATSFSRSSLLCGELICGAQNIEKRGFQEFADFRYGKPVLFHKDEVGSSGADLSESLRLAVSKNDSKIVGVVLNVIDDSLSGPEQLSIRWNLRSIAVLQTLLNEAKSAGRVVILASDHGHVLDYGSKLTRKADAADRWRPSSGIADISGDELEVNGQRVLAEGGQITAPTSERTRYTANRRHGYHGGLTAQECIVPVAVLAPRVMEIEGWGRDNSIGPDWWQDEESDLVSERMQPRSIAKNGTALKPTMPLFERSGAARDWVDALLASNVFIEQMETFAGRMKKEQVEEYLRVLAERNLVLLKSAFAQKLEISSLRVDGMIASLQRILNVEGYPVLSVDSSQTIRLNLQLLKEQFELGDEYGR
ncbi:BREX-2 system phosphatase PglZ [Tunturiibacter gelidoferens]|uniref:BREX-2 system phosphatase PglZ n=1 Tax=Tunturiibacter lichenicola TaxID=2051959 RepID=A0A7Y9TCJ2_9BACT|nr:BREX-2 system phosphatase PglZ [Edaphobacter lichenicola]NYF54060.1 hypothetical protein [Edaphobacter lichenicola]